MTLPGAIAPGSLDVSFAGLRSTKGVIRLCLTANAKRFPDCKGDARAVTRSVPAAGGALRIDGLAPGDYAISIIHDENSNAKLDTFAGIPKEGVGFSRNPRIMFGPPRFDAARFGVGGDVIRQSVRLQYFL